MLYRFSAPPPDASTFSQLKMALAGPPWVRGGIKDLSDTGEVHVVAPTPKNLKSVHELKLVDMEHSFKHCCYDEVENKCVPQ